MLPLHWALLYFKFRRVLSALRINKRKPNFPDELKQRGDKSSAQTETLYKIKSPYLILNITQVQQRKHSQQDPRGASRRRRRQTGTRSGPHYVPIVDSVHYESWCTGYEEVRYVMGLHIYGTPGTWNMIFYLRSLSLPAREFVSDAASFVNGLCIKVVSLCFLAAWSCK